MNELALFAGAGGGILATQLLGHRCVCAVEIEPYAQSVLVARQNDRCLPPFPIWDDVRTFDGHRWRGIVDVVSGGFPCQDLSTAGKGAGLSGENSGLWREMARIIGEVQPRIVFIENSPMLINRGLERVLADLAGLGFDAEWGCLPASFVGAPHNRNRVWIVANAQWDKQSREKSCQRTLGRMGRQLKPVAWDGNWQDALRKFRGMDDGLARIVDRTDCIRNGQVPAVAASAYRLLGGC